MIFQCLMSNSNFSLQIQTFSNLRKVVQIKPNQISNVKFKSNSNQTPFEAFPSSYQGKNNILHFEVPISIHSFECMQTQ